MLHNAFTAKQQNHNHNSSALETRRFACVMADAVHTAPGAA